MIDRSLGQRSKLVGYQYSEIFSALTMVYFCSGDHLEAETLQRIFNRLEERSITVAHFRADCGSFSEDIVRTVFGRGFLKELRHTEQ